MARPPPAGDAEPDLIEFGIPVLDDRLVDADVTFPTSRDELVDAHGDLAVPYDAHGHTVTLAEVLDQVHQDEFESRHDLLDALHPVFEAYRQRATVGILGRLRSFLPF